MENYRPHERCKSIYVPVYKKEKKTGCDNYQTISLLPHASKLILRIVNNRIRGKMSEQIAKEQAGFVKGRSTREEILNMRQLIEKSREYNVPIVLCSIDYRKAFDNVIWKKLWEILLEMGASKHIVHLIQKLYESNQNIVVLERGTQSEEFTVKKGVKQGCVLSPILFNLYEEHMMRKVLGLE